MESYVFRLDCHLRTDHVCVCVLGELLDAGMNVARLNFSHGDHEMHARSLQNLRKAVEARPGCHCAVLLDTKGPEIRTGLLKDHKPVQLEVRVRFSVTHNASLALSFG